MINFKKKLFLLFFAAFASLCLGFGILYLTEQKADAAETEPTRVTITDNVFEISNGDTFVGFKESFFTGIGKGDFIVVLPDSVTKIGAGNAVTENGAIAVNSLFTFKESGEIKYNAVRGFKGIEAPKVTELGYRAFVNCSALSRVDLHGVRTLGSGAFYGCSSLTTIYLPEIGTVSDDAFKGCSSLYSVILGTVTEIKDSAFENCGTISYQFPSSLQKIGKWAFKGCGSLTSVDLSGTNINQMGAGVFESCVNLNKIKFPGNISAIPDDTFSGCVKLNKVNTDVEGFELPSNITSVGNNAFKNCIAITKLTVPAQITSIGKSAFYGMTAVTEINYFAINATLVDQVTPFGLSASDYEKHSNVVVNIGDIPVGDPVTNTITHLPSGLFQSQAAVKTINVQNVNLVGVQSFGLKVFADCTSLTTVNFSSGCTITVINADAFNGCTNLYQINGFEGILNLETISAQAFYNCSSLTTIGIGQKVTSIGDLAFYNCERLIEVKNLSALAIQKGAATYGKVAENAKHVYGRDGSSRIKAQESFDFYVDSTAGSSEVLLIGYTGSNSIVSLPVYYNEVPNTLYDIYMSAFKSNETITKLSIPSGAKVRNIGASAFAGCKALEDVTIESNEVLSLGANAFAGCVSLKSVVFSSGCKISSIPDFAFASCALETVIIPRAVINIGTSAFAECKSLKSVDFTAAADKSYKLNTIKGSAFSGCESLVAIEIPETVTSIGAGAFFGCAALEFVYLPSGGNSTVAYGNTGNVANGITDAFSGCNAKLLLISKNKTQYDKDKTNAGLAAFVSNDALTYMVNLRLVYQDGVCVDGIHNDVRLYKQPVTRVRIGLTWQTVGSMPLQNCPDAKVKYSFSKWFYNQDYTSQVTETNLNQEHLNKDGVDTITMYARYVPQPEFVAQSVPYAVNKEYSVKDMLVDIFREKDGSAITQARAEELLAKYHFNVKKSVGQDSWMSIGSGKITTAGSYSVEVSLPIDGSWGSWSENKTFSFVIERGTLDVTDLLVWETQNGGRLDPYESKDGKPVTTKLYFYDGTTTPHLEPTTGVTEDRSVQIARSYTIYSGREVILSLAWLNGNNTYGQAVASSYTGNRATAAGTYTASVTLKPNENYIFTHDKKQDLALLNTYGLVFVEQDDGSILVRKTWYIAVSNANQLMNNDGNGLFSINSTLDFYSSVIPSKPKTSKIPLQSDNLISFTLQFIDTKSTSHFFGNADNKISLAEYPKYFNATMPAGTYIARFYIANGTDENDKMVMGDPQGKEFTFKVRETQLTQNDSILVSNVLKNSKVPYSDGKINFLSVNGTRLLNENNPSKPWITSGSAVGVWAEERFAKYYGPLQIKYQVVRGINQTAGYYTLAEYERGVANDGTNIALELRPQAIGNYTVRYCIGGPNFGTKGNEFGGMIEGQYSLSITHTLKPVLRPYEYQAGNVLNEVIADLSRWNLEYFNIYTILDYTTLKAGDPLLGSTVDLYGRVNSDGSRNPVGRPAPNSNVGLANDNWYNGSQFDEYKEIGTHKIFLKVKSEYKEYIIWDVTLTIDTAHGDKYLVLPVEIIATANRELTPLSVNKWEYGEFTREDNSPNWVLQFEDDYKKYSFILTSKTDESKKYYFFGDETKVLADGQLGFNMAPAGEYTLLAIAPPYDGSDRGDFTSECNVKIDKANLRFTTIPFIDSWNYGNDNAANLVPAYTLGGNGADVKGKIAVRYCKAEEFEKANGALFLDIKRLNNKEGKLDAGVYYLVYSLDETDNFNAWRYGVRFSILPAANSWKVTPTIHDWFYGEDANRAELKYDPTFGVAANVKISYKINGVVMAWVNSIEELSTYDSVKHRLKAGTYEFKASLGATDNYEKLEFITTFEVKKAQNTWDKAPSIEGWAQGRYVVNNNYPQASTKLGSSVQYKLFEAGTDKELDMKNISSLGIGKYYIEAIAEGDDNYEGLSARVYFHVTEDSVGMTGLMVATIILSIVALGLAGAGITFLILRNMKAEEEFRKAIRNELRRK